MDTREKILKGAGSLFVEYGVRNVTMDMIAQDMGISKRTIYVNFKDKEDLLRSFLSETISDHKKAMIERINNSENLFEALFSFGECHSKYVLRFLRFVEDIRTYYNDMFESLIGDSSNAEVSYALLKRGIDEGSLIPTIDVRIVNVMINMAMRELIHVKNPVFPRKNVWYSFFLPYMKGICTEQGLESLGRFMEKLKVNKCDSLDMDKSWNVAKNDVDAL